MEFDGGRAACGRLMLLFCCTDWVELDVVDRCGCGREYG